MDPHSFIVRAEAQRWIGIAEKLLMGHDLVGSKTFAIRARDSDPRLEAADQILAIADTLLAAEKRVVGNNGAQQPDFYAILQLVRFVQDTEHIAAQYRRLAVTLNPHQNRFPYSDQAFQLVNDAWAVLSNPMRKSMYDADLDFPPQQQMNTIGFNLEQHHHQQHNFFSVNQMRSGHERELSEPPQTFQTRAQQSHQGSGHERELSQSPQTFQTRAQQSHQQHNFLSQPNPVRPVPVREQEQLFQQREQDQPFQPQVQPFQITLSPQQQSRPPPQPPQPQPPMQPPSPPPPAAPPQSSLSWPQAPPLSQPQPQPQPQPPQPQQQQPLLSQAKPQRQQQPNQEQQVQQPSFEQNAAPVPPSSQVNSNNGAREEETEIETEAAAENVDDSPTFWTTCPYCFYMYEYPRVYAECTLRCDNCKRAFQAVPIPSPPPVTEGQEAYFCCWGFFPVGVSMSHLEKNNGTHANSKWTPFSPLYDASSNVQGHLNGKAAPKKNVFVKKSSGPRVYIDDVVDDVFMGISEPSDDSDVEWDVAMKKKVKRMKKGTSHKKKAQDRERDAGSGGGKNLQHSIPAQDDVGAPTMPVTERSKKAVGSKNPTTQSVRVKEELGKLDLNVEFNNNEGEEHTPGITAGNRGHGQGEDDNIEGIGFFEGLDEFLSNLPILSVVGDEKVKAA